MEREAVPTSSVFFGTDGTQLPDPLPVLPDALTGPEHSTWQQTPEISTVPLPSLPDDRAMRAAITAVLADDPAAPAGGAARNLPARPATGPILPRPLTPARSTPARSTPSRSTPARSTPARSTPSRSTPARSTPARLTPDGAGQRAFQPFPKPADLRRRFGQEATRSAESSGRLQRRSSSGVRTGCIIALIIIGVIAFNIIAAIVQGLSALFS